MKRLTDFIEDLDSCVKCGTCRSVCPIYRVEGREPASTRGRLTLIGARARGELPLSETYIRQVKDCTLCGACVSSCPAGVDTPGIVAAARAELAEAEGRSPVAGLVFRGLADPGRLVPLAVKCAAYMQGVFLKGAAPGDAGAAGDSGLLSRFNLPIPGARMGRLFPPLARTPFMDSRQAKAHKSAGGERSGAGVIRVAFYVGCGINYLMPEVGEKTIDLLGRAGAEVVVPEGQVCCGMPAYAAGEAGAARDMAVRNIEELERHDVDYVVTACATCGHGLRNNFRALLADDPVLLERAEALSGRVRDVSELLVDVFGFESEGGEGQERVVTYHDPCHLGRAQGVREQPRDLLKTNPNLTLKEMSHPCRCCGLGGGLSMANYEMSSEIGSIKAESVRDSGADVVATGCPGCIVQLRDSLHRLGVDAKVKHVVELL
ncbi:MAG: (Fe-S)-binding protein [Thermodesulfobacteriota bacterium]